MKRLPKVDFKKLAMETAGEAGGIYAVDAVGKMPFVAKQKPIVKGLIYKVLGAVVVPALAGKAKKGGELITGVGNALSVAGTSQILNAVTKGKTPAIGGYEQNPIQGPGYEMIDGPDEGNGSDGSYEMD